MNFIKIIFSLFFLITAVNAEGEYMSKDPENTIQIELKSGNVIIELMPDIAPNHSTRIKELAREGFYDGVPFHRVIEGFMAQTGDVEFGNSSNDKFNLSRAGTGGSSMPDIEAEFSNINHGRGAVSMARAQNPNSANSQFFICFNDCSFLDGQYSVWGQVVEGMEFVDNITRGEPPTDPDKIIKMEIID